MADNISTDTDTTVPEQTVVEQTPPQPPKPTIGPNSMLSAREAADLCMQHFQRQLKMQVRFPPQIVDGCAVEFFDADLPSITYASAKLRLRNVCAFDNESGELKIVASLSDLAMKK